MIKMFYICVEKYDNHYPYVVTEAFKECLGDWGTKFFFNLIIINLNLNCHMWLVANELENAGLEIYSYLD